MIGLLTNALIVFGFSAFLFVRIYHVLVAVFSSPAFLFAVVFACAGAVAVLYAAGKARA